MDTGLTNLGTLKSEIRMNLEGSFKIQDVLTAESTRNLFASCTLVILLKLSKVIGLRSLRPHVSSTCLLASNIHFFGFRVPNSR